MYMNKYCMPFVQEILPVRCIESAACPYAKAHELWLLAARTVLREKGTLMESLQAPAATDPDPT